MNKSFKTIRMSKYLKTSIIKVSSTVSIRKGSIYQIGDVCRVLVIDVIDGYTLRISPT